METKRKLNRRSFVTSVIGGAAAGGALVAITGRAEAQTYTGVTDSDTGNGADAPGYGRGTRNVYTDRDTGPNADAQFHGRGPGGVNSPGQYNEPATGCSDSDGGPGSDPGGRGRRCGRPGVPRDTTPTSTRHCTDSDTGNSVDPVREGRHC